jgi:hypothetical protein
MNYPTLNKLGLSNLDYSTHGTIKYFRTPQFIFLQINNRNFSVYYEPSVGKIKIPGQKQKKYDYLIYVDDIAAKDGMPITETDIQNIKTAVIDIYESDDLNMTFEQHVSANEKIITINGKDFLIKNKHMHLLIGYKNREIMVGYEYFPVKKKLFDGVEISLSDACYADNYETIQDENLVSDLKLVLEQYWSQTPFNQLEFF